MRRSGSRAAALLRLAATTVGRLRTEARTQAYVAKRIGEGHSKLEAIRCLKRYIALNFIRRHVPQGTTLYGDAAGPWNEFYSRYTLHRVNHEEAYSLGGEHEINTNAAESFFSRIRRGEIGHHHHVAGPYLIRFAQEAAWRENYRRAPNGAQVDRIVALAMHNKPSVDFCGYWQRSQVAA